MMALMSDYHTYIILTFIMMLLSFFFSGAETALLTSNRFHLETLAKTGSRRARLSLSILDNKEETMGMLLVGINIVEIAATAFISYVATVAFMLSESKLLAVTAVQTLLFLLLCELTPKVVARARAESFLMFCSYPMKALLTLLNPAVKVSLFFSRALKSVLGVTGDEISGIRSRDEIDILFKIGEEEGIITEDHHVYVSEILSSKSIIAREIMTPTVDFASIELGKSLRELADIFVHTRYSRIPVYDSRADNIIGYVFYRDFLKGPGVKKIDDIINKANFVPATKNIFELYSEMVENLIPMVFVVNEFGAVIGMVTHEDIAEEVVGEIQTRDQSDADIVTELGRGRYLLSGRLDIEYFMKMFKVAVEKKGFETLSGFVAYRLGKIPKKGDRFVYDGYTFIIDEATERSVEKIVLQSVKQKMRITGRA